MLEAYLILAIMAVTFLASLTIGIAGMIAAISSYRAGEKAQTVGYAILGVLGLGSFIRMLVALIIRW